MEALEKPVVDRVLQAMARAYPDPVDLPLLSMVVGADLATLRAAVAQLQRAGLARSHAAADGGEPRPDTACATDRGMAVAYGVAADADDAAALLDRLEARTLRALLAARVAGSRLPAAQADELRTSLGHVADDALVHAARIWAHQPVSDWRALVHALAGDGARLPARA